MSSGRRNFLKYAVTAIVAGVVAGVGGYFGGAGTAPPPPPPVTQTVPGPTVTQTQTVPGPTVTQSVTETVPGPTVTQTVTPPPPPTAAATPPAPGPFPGAVTLTLPLDFGFAKDRGFYFLTFETSDPIFAFEKGVPYAPRMSTFPHEALESLWVFTNGVKGQRDIIAALPGDKEYTPFWHLHEATWKVPPAERTLVTSAETLKQLIDDGKVEGPGTNNVFNCPVLFVDVGLDGSGGTQPETLHTGPAGAILQANLGPVNPTVSLFPFPSFHDGELVPIFGFEFAYQLGPVLAAFPPNNRPPFPISAIPDTALVKTMAFAPDGPITDPAPTHNPVANIWFVPNNIKEQHAVLDSVPGKDEESLTKYSPLWHVHTATFKDGETPIVLTSVDEINANKPKLDVGSLGKSGTFNCPVIAASLVLQEFRVLHILDQNQFSSLMTFVQKGHRQAFLEQVGELVNMGVLAPELAGKLTGGKPPGAPISIKIPFA